MKVEVYGGNHSPWVQAVLLALHDKQIDHELRPLPPFATFRKWGVFMPVVSVNGAPWEKESSDILVARLSADCKSRSAGCARCLARSTTPS